MKKIAVGIGAGWNLHGVLCRGTSLGRLVGVVLGALLHFAKIFLGVDGAPICLDGLLAIGRELGLPMSLALLVLGEGILLVLVVVLLF